MKAALVLSAACWCTLASASISRVLLGSVFRFNETQIDRILDPSSGQRPLLDAVHVLKDDNFEAVLRTGTEDPWAQELPSDTIWVISVYAGDKLSTLFEDSFEAVARDNSSYSVTGTLPARMKFARLDYQVETVLTTWWWTWRAPSLIILQSEKPGKTPMTAPALRFYTLSDVHPRQSYLSQFLSNPVFYERKPVWRGVISPLTNRQRSEYLLSAGRQWARAYKKLSKVPTFVWLALSGAAVNFIIGWMHQKPAPPPPRRAPPSTRKPGDALRARLASSGNTSVASSDPSTGRSSALQSAVSSSSGRSDLDSPLANLSKKEKGQTELKPVHGRTGSLASGLRPRSAGTGAEATR